MKGTCKVTKKLLLFLNYIACIVGWVCLEVGLEAGDDLQIFNGRLVKEIYLFL